VHVTPRPYAVLCASLKKMTCADVCCVAVLVDSQCHTAPAAVSLRSSSSSSSSSVRHETLVSSGFLSSPNYPQVRALIADCWWTLTVQPSQTIRLTLYDFQLSVKTANICRDYLRISAVTLTSARSEVTVFEDCGSRGLEVIDVAASRVHLHFHTDQSSQTHRGFLIHYAGSSFVSSCYLNTGRNAELPLSLLITFSL